MIFIKSNLIYWLRYWLFDVFQLMSIEIYLYSTSLRARQLLHRSCLVYWSYSCRERHESVEDSSVELSSEIFCSFSISLARGLNMIILVELIRLTEESTKLLELSSSMRVWSCRWLGVAYPYWGRGRNSNIEHTDQMQDFRLMSQDCRLRNQQASNWGTHRIKNPNEHICFCSFWSSSSTEW